MKNKKKILSLIACLSLLTSCNKGTSSNSSCSITTSTPTSSVTQEEKTIIDYIETSTITSTDTLINGTLRLVGFSDELPIEMKLKTEEITIPEEINGIKLSSIGSEAFKGFDNLKRIKLSKNINHINTSEILASSSPFINLIALESIEVDQENAWYYTRGNCLIQKNWTVSGGNRVNSNTCSIVCGWNDVEIPDEINEIRQAAFSSNSTITSVKLNSNITKIGKYSLRGMPMLNNVDLNGNTTFKIDGNVLYKANSVENGTYSDYIYSAWGEITIPSDIEKISDDYGKTSLYLLPTVTKLTIPSSLKEISSGYYSIYLDNLDEIVVDTNPNFEVKDNCLIYKSSSLITLFKEAIIPSTITSLNNIIYSNILTKVFIPKSVSFINSSAFDYCTKLKKENVIFEEGSQFSKNDVYIIDTTINKLVAILDKMLLKEVIIPDDVTLFNNSIFYSIPLLEKVVFNENLNSFKSSFFLDSKTNIKEIEFKSKNIIEIDKVMFNGLPRLERIILPEENNKYAIKGNTLYDKETNDILVVYGDVDFTSFGDLSSQQITYHYSRSMTSLKLSKNNTGIVYTSGTSSSATFPALFTRPCKCSTIYLSDMNYDEFKDWYAYSLFVDKYATFSKIVFSDNSSKTLEELLTDLNN